jgi:hypothetical protein
MNSGRAPVRTAHGDSSTGSELKAVEGACREASRTVEPLNDWNDWNGLVAVMGVFVLRVREMRRGENVGRVS